MRGTEFPVVKDVVLVGGGHAHVSVLRTFGMKPVNGARVTLISPEVHTPYSGMLPGLIAGHYSFDDAHIDLGPLARFANARLYETAVERIDPLAKVVHCTDGRPPVPYDILSINTGSTPVFDTKLTLNRDVIPVKPVSQFLSLWQRLQELIAASPDRRIGIIGAGAGGIELLLSMQHALATTAGLKAGQGPGRFHVFTRDDSILKTHGAKVRDTMHNALAERGVNIHTQFNVTKVDDAGVSDGNRVVPIDDIVWVTGAQPPSWFAESGLAVDDRGFIAVDRRLHSTSHPDIFGAGDAVTIRTDPRPKSGVFAVRQGPVLARNIRARLTGDKLQSYRPQRAFLSLISTGDKYAIASYAGHSFRGEWVWRWKDRIDRAFMTKFNELPSMAENLKASAPTVAELPPEVTASLVPGAMRCAGCGAKVGPDILARALQQISSNTPARERDCEIILGIGDDAAVIRLPPDKLLVQTVDSFPAMIGDPFTFGQIAANHSLGDIYAMAAKPHSALLIATVPFAASAKREADLAQLLAGARKVLDAADCSIIGGHTAEGTELTLGLSINGTANEQQLTTKRHLLPGQALILTKPVGTGALFAADARGKSKGRWTNAAIQGALQSSAAAADILRSNGATAMTDITGFGLVGHLGDMLAASNLRAELRLSDVPLLEGAVAVVAKGIVSSLQRDNLIWREEIDTSPDIAGSTEFQLLFDPQTAGGLLAGVPAANAAAAISDLHASGYRGAAIIGTTFAANHGTSSIRLM